MLRGQVWRAKLPGADDAKLWIVVSHNARNRNFDTVLGVRVTTTNRNRHLPTVVEVPEGECVNGWVTCDSMTEIWDEDLVDKEPIGSVSPRFLGELQPALLATLGF